MDKNFKGTEEEYKEFRRKRNLANKKYYSKPKVKENRKVYCKGYRIKNKDKISEYGYELRARAETQSRIKKWREDNKEHLRKYRQTKEYKIKKSESDKRWREKNKDKLKRIRMNPEVRARKKERYEKNKEHLRDLRRAYYLSEQGKLSVQNCNHRKLALKKNQPTDLTRKKIREIFSRDKVCVYCGSNKDFELDHIIPLTKGGSCMFNNLVLSCAKCNRSKSGRDVFYWCNLQGIEVPKIILELLEE